MMDSSGQRRAERDGSSAWRRRQRRLPSWWRHEQQSIVMALAAAQHHSAQKSAGTVSHNVLRNQNTSREETEYYATSEDSGVEEFLVLGIWQSTLGYSGVACEVRLCPGAQCLVRQWIRGLRQYLALDEFHTISTFTWTRILKYFSLFSRRMENCAQPMLQLAVPWCAARTWNPGNSSHGILVADMCGCRGQCTGTGPCKLVSETDVASLFCGHSHPSSSLRNNDNTNNQQTTTNNQQPTVTTTPRWLALLSCWACGRCGCDCRRKGQSTT